ncbi:MAG: nucleoside triphosphate pyrophosphohydrolase [Actinomycetota bacterium]|nr:nucleoside triphosphate pyrophosphohydrolase [Actinomycetota bacterium]
MVRLVLVDTADELPGLLPLHAWSALMSSDLVLLGTADHPFVAHLAMAELRYEVVEDAGAGALSRADLLSGLTPADKAKATSIVDRVRAEGEVVYLFGTGDDDGFTRTLGMEAARAGVEVEVVYFGVRPPGTRLLELVRIEQRLLAPGGCPWDREQDHRSLARYAVEEVYELLEAIESGDRDAIREELGDVLLQVVFHAQLASKDSEAAQSFDIDDVAADIIAKLVRRHPHVFGDTQVAGSADVVANWEQLKAAEKPERSGPFDGVPAAQPALAYVEKLQSRAAGLGFDWDLDAEAADRIRLELEEFTAAGNDTEREREIGDLLMSVVGLARRHGLDPEMALRGSARRFRERFEAVVATADRPLAELDRAGWLRLWDAAKAREHVAAPEPDRT